MDCVDSLSWRNNVREMCLWKKVENSNKILNRRANWKVQKHLVMEQKKHIQRKMYEQENDACSTDSLLEY